MNESKVISCLNHVLSDSIVKAHDTKQNETTFINNATSTLVDAYYRGDNRVVWS
jgi:hypothetical protein